MKLAAINATLSELIPEKKSPLFEAAHYSLRGGKRLRPLLLLAVLESASVPIEIGLYPACAIEMIHTYSLIHDDLPCMDNDDLRRGKPTLHKIYPESHALLAGDFLLTYAFKTLSAAPELSNEQKLKLIDTLSEAAGSQGMIGGQLLDIDGSTDWEHIHRMKTGALINCALLCGGIIASLDHVPLKDLGQALGPAYQLVDDLLDGDGAVKQFGSAWVENKIAHLDRRVEDLLISFPGDAKPISEIASLMIHRTI